MDVDLLFDKVFLENKSLSENGREEIVYELINVYEQMPNRENGVGVMTFISLEDKDLIMTLISAYEAFAMKHFIECGRDPSKIGI